MIKDADSPRSLASENRLLRAKVKHLENELNLLRQETVLSKTDFLDAFHGKEEIIEERTKALSAMEKRFLQMAGAISEVYWMAAIDFSAYLYVSPSFSSLWDQPAESLYQNPGLWLECIDPRDRDLVLANRKQVAKGTATYEEFRIAGKDGAPLWIANTSYPIRADNGDVEGVTGIARDITQVREIGEILKASKQEWEATFDSIPDCICILDKDRVITRMNKAMAGRLGGHPREYVGRQCCAVLCGDEVKDCCTVFDDTRNATEPLEFSFPRLGGEHGGWFLVSATPLKDVSQGRHRTVLVFRDITRRRLAEAKYRDLFQHTSSGIFRADTSGAFLSVNPALAAMLGYSSVEECLDNSPAFKDLICDPDLPPRILAQVKAKGQVDDLETTIRRRDGETIWVRINARAPNREQDQACCAGFIEDITKRRQAEQSLAQSQRLEAMGILAGGIAHDFNNILSAIIGYTDLALAESTPIEQRNANLQHVINAGRRARDLVKQILTFSRGSSQKAGRADLVPITTETLNFLRSSLPASISIEQRLPAASPLVLMAQSKLHQVIMNLCTNAVQAMQGTGGILRVELDELTPVQTGELGLNLEEQPLVRLRVSDTGSGIDSKTMPRIFDPYFTTKGVGEGTGMGLAVVHGIVRGHGGEITVESTPGAGTCFSVYFPLAKGRSKAAAPGPSGREKNGNGERILVVDDEKALVGMLKQMLRSLGYETIGANSSTLALQLFQADPDMFDLVLTDQTMPNMTGIELAKTFADIRPDMPVLIYTGHGNCSQGVNLPPNIRLILEKPLEKKALAAILRQCLGATEPDAERAEKAEP